MTPPLGTGFELKLDRLLVKVEVGLEGWTYQLIKLDGNRIVKSWKTCMPPAVSGNAMPEGCKFEAIQAALAELGRNDDPHVILRNEEWIPYGPGHGA